MMLPIPKTSPPPVKFRTIVSQERDHAQAELQEIAQEQVLLEAYLRRVHPDLNRDYERQKLV